MEVGLKLSELGRARLGLGEGEEKTGWGGVCKEGLPSTRLDQVVNLRLRLMSGVSSRMSNATVTDAHMQVADERVRGQVKAGRGGRLEFSGARRRSSATLTLRPRQGIDGVN